MKRCPSGHVPLGAYGTDDIRIKCNCGWSAASVDVWEKRGEVEKMMVFYSDDFEGVWPVGVAAVIVAPDEENARILLTHELNERGLEQKKPFTLKKIDTNSHDVIIISDGDY